MLRDPYAEFTAAAVAAYGTDTPSDRFTGFREVSWWRGRALPYAQPQHRPSKTR